MKKNTAVGTVMLLVCAVIWGTAFVAQSEAMDFMGPLTFQAMRSYMGGLFLVPVIAAADALKKRSGRYEKITPQVRRRTFIVGIVCGTILCVASLFQQYGIALGTSGGNAGFITALYILLVPVAGLVFFRKKVHPALWLCIAAALVGLWFICIKEGGTTFRLSDILVLICAFIFTAHIVTVDRCAGELDGIRVSCIQFFTSAVIATAGMLIFEKPTAAQMLAGWIPIIYAGVMSSGVAYTLQILGQQRTDPTIASLLMSLESVFAVIGTVTISLINGAPEYPTARELVGCTIMFAAIIAAQLLPEKKKEGT